MADSNKPKMAGLSNAKKRKLEDGSKGRGRFQLEWIKLYPDIIKASAVGTTHAFCIICNKDINVAASGLYDLKIHFKTMLHERQFELKKKARSSITSYFGQPKEEHNSVTRAEVLFANFVAQHNLAASVADHFSDLAVQMFPDSDIAKKFRSKRVKTTNIITKCLASAATESVIHLCRQTPFSLMIDESNDKKTDKRLAVMVRVFEDGVGPKSRLLDMPVCSGGTSEAIFNDVDAVFTNLNIPWSNCIGFSSDNCNVMIGNNNSVLTRIKQKKPEVFNIGCICHLANLCVLDGMKQLTVPIDDLLVDIYYYFQHSSKRRKTYKEFQLFTQVDDLNILKHCSTRWLSLGKVVDRVLNQYPALSSYFESHDDVEKPGRVKNIHKQLKSPLTQMTLRFLQFVLPILTEFNTLFQSDESQIAGMMEEMDRLLRKLLVKFIQMKYIKDVTDLQLLKYDDLQLHHDDTKIAIAMSNRTFMEEMDIDVVNKTTFFKDVRNFYIAVVRKMLKKFPFQNQILKNLKILEPALKADTREPICRLAAIFAPHLDQESIADEYDDYCMLPDDCVSVLTEKGKRRGISNYWCDIFSLKTSIGSVRFPLLKVVIQRLLTLRVKGHFR